MKSKSDRKRIFNSVFNKVTGLLFLILLFVFIIIISTFATFGSMSSDSNAINIAGSERMRAILLGFTANEYVQFLEIDANSEKTKNELALLEEELERYELFLNGLRKGDKKLKLSTPKSKKLIKNLNTVEEIWVDCKASITIVIDKNSTLEDKKNAVEKLSTKEALKLKNQMHTCVQILNSESNQKILFAKIFQLVFLLLSILLFIISIFILKRILFPLKKMKSILKNLSDGDGDLTKKVDIRTNDEIGDVAASLNKFIDKIKDVVSQVKEISRVNTTAAEEISSTSELISNSSSNQAMSVDEIAGSIHNITDAIEKNSKNAQDTNEIAQQTSTQAKNGGVAVENAITAINQINQKISLIDEIAAQTNLLALNAAIEAARAGDHGKGFAVVAGEVRALAEKSLYVSKEINEIADEGVTISGTAGKEIKAIIENVDKTAELIEIISESTRHQDSEINGINNNIIQLNDAAMNTAATSEELSATVAMIQESIATLDRLMGFFITD